MLQMGRHDRDPSIGSFWEYLAQGVGDVAGILGIHQSHIVILAELLDKMRQIEAAIRGGQQELRKLAMEIVGDNDMGPFDNGSGHHLISSCFIGRDQLMDAVLGFGRKFVMAG